jgi:type I restriction enzyme S subunit
VSNVDKKTVDGEMPVRLCNYTDVYYNDVITDDFPLMAATATTAQIARFSLRAGDTVITKDSETAADIGVPAFVPNDLPGVVCGYHLAIVRPRCGVDPRYLSWCLASSAVRDQLAVEATGVTRFGLRSESLANVATPDPDLASQRAIADFLDAETARIDTLIGKRLTMLQLLRERSGAISLAGASGELTSTAGRVKSSIPWITDRPESWQEVQLKLVAALGSGHTPSRSRPEWWVPDECVVPWVTTGEVARLRSDREYTIVQTREKISRVGLANSSAVIHPTGTVVLCRTASVGYSGIMAGPMATSQDFATWTCGPLLRPAFLLLCLRAMRSDLLGRLAMGSTHKTIYMPDIETIQVPLPPIEEQDQVVAQVQSAVSELDMVDDALTQQIALLRERKRALITAAVTGELDVTKRAS